jgi:kynurenine formamidase
MSRPEEIGAPSNWGRWGTDDQRGTANLLTEAGVRAAASLVRRGKVYSLAAPLSPDGPSLPSRRQTWHDALSHFFVEDHLYNGHPAAAIQPFGAQKCGIEHVGPLVGRGVLLDLAAYRGVEHLGDTDAVEPDELEACAAAQGVTLQVGDILLLRTGWWRLFSQGAAARQRFYSSEPGPSGACGAWFKERDLVALGADNPAVEVVRSWTEPLPLHRDILWGCGGYLLEFLDLEALAADRVYEFLFVATPLRIDGGIGSPIAPVVIV